MASITSWQTVNTQQNNTGSEIELPNAVKGDIIVAIADVGGADTKPDIEISGADQEELADLLTSPEYEKVTEHTTTSTTCRRYYHYRYPYYRYHWYYGYYWNYRWYYGRWGYRTRCTTRTRTYTTTDLQVAQTRALVSRVKTEGPVTLAVTGEIPNDDLDRFTVVHLRPDVDAASGKNLKRVTWVPRAKQAQEDGDEKNRYNLALNTYNIVFALGSGNEGDGADISINSGTNLVKQEFAWKNKIRTVFRMDFIESDGDYNHTFNKLNIAKFIKAYASDIREAWASFPTTSGVFWIETPAKVNADLTYTYPPQIEALLNQAENVDPVSTGLEIRFPKGSYQTDQDSAGQVNVESWDELHLLRFPDSLNVSTSIGDVFTSDADVEAYINQAEKDW